jgi:hypothetical protein
MGKNMKAKIVILEESEQGALGVLVLDNVIFCFCLLPDDADQKKFHLSTGSYLCKRFHGTKWPNTFEIVVEGHTAVLFHSGNTEVDSKGCVLLGSTTGKLKGNRAVLNSGDTFKAFLDYTKNINEFPLTVVDCL